jgi:serine/threonine protein kinase
MALRRKTPADESAVFPGFTNVREIGGGGFATVYSAKETDTGRPVALKLLNIRDAPPHALESFRRETLALGSLSTHPNIVTLYRTMTSADDRPVLVMELCKESIYQQAKTSPPPMQRSVSVAVKIAGALETAHRAGMLHRDVKPQNILLTHYDEPALADFGVARLQSSSEATAGVFGFTTIHAAPEMLEGAVATAATDVYELASTLYQLLEGRAAFRTFDGEAPASVILRILRDPVPPLSAADAPIALSDLLVSAMAKSPDERPPSSAAFAEALNDIERTQDWPLTHFALMEEPVAASAESDSVTAARPADRPSAKQAVPLVPVEAVPEPEVEVEVEPVPPAPAIALHRRVTESRPVAPTPVRARNVITPQALPPKPAPAAPPVAPPPAAASSQATPVSAVQTPDSPTSPSPLPEPGPEADRRDPPLHDIFADVVPPRESLGSDEPAVDNFFGYGAKPIDRPDNGDILEQTIVPRSDAPGSGEDNDEGAPEGSRLRHALKPLLGRRKHSED